MVVCFYFQFTNAHEKTVLKSLGIETTEEPEELPVRREPA